MKIGCICLSVGLLAIAGCSRRPAQDKVEAAAAKLAQPLRVKVAPAESRRVDKKLSVTGSLAADEAVTVSNEVAGKLAVMHVDFGQAVRANDVLAELDKQELRLQLDRVRASLAQALARIGLEPGQEETVPETTPAIRQAQAQLEDMRSRYESAARLVKTGDIANERFVEIEKAYRAREAAVDAARHELRTALASIQALRAEVRLAEKRLNDATIRAPFAGSVSERHASPGQYLRENTPIVTLVKTYPLRLRVEVPESAASHIRPGTDLTFTTDAVPDAEFHAVVREINPSLDARSRSLTAEARLTQSDMRLRPGMFVQVRLVTERDATVVVVPKEAIHSIAGLTKIFTVQDGRAKELKITPGPEIDGWVEVRDAAIPPGALVAVSELAALVDGATVQTVPRS